MSYRILFVDDDANILHGLERMLRPMREEWEMTFAEGPEQALATLAAGTYDVVVSDMRMPGMSGAQLLARVRDLYPATVRIVLTGQADEESMLQLAGPAHQYLSKPCDQQELRTVISRTCALRACLSSEGLRGVIARVSVLPTLPSLYFDLVNELEDEDPSIVRVAEIVSRDVGLIAKCLQLVNSGFLGLRRRVSEPVDAVKILGLRTIWSLTLSHQTFSQYDARKLEQFPIETVTSHCLRVGALARTISQALGHSEETLQDAFTAGLMHDVGKLVLADNLPVEEGLALRQACAGGVTLAETERAVLATTHQEVGAYLLGLWGLRDTVLEAVLFHHTMPVAPAADLPVALAVHLANVLDHEAFPQPKGGAAPLLAEDTLAAAGLTEALEKLRATCAPGAEGDDRAED